MTDFKHRTYGSTFFFFRGLMDDDYIEVHIPWWRIIQRIKYGKVRNVTWYNERKALFARGPKGATVEPLTELLARYGFKYYPKKMVYFSVREKKIFTIKYLETTGIPEIVEKMYEDNLNWTFYSTDHVQAKVKEEILDGLRQYLTDRNNYL